MRDVAFKVRPARPGDRGRLLELWERAARSSHDFLGEEGLRKLRPLVEAELADAAYSWWVLARSREPAGFLAVAGRCIEGLFIDPPHQRRGGGRLLVDHARALCGDQPLAVDVNEGNVAALRFYRALGFDVAGRSAMDGAGRPYPILHLRQPA